MKREEALNQEALIKWWDYSYPLVSKMLFAIPNGGFRNPREAVALKRQGVRAGVYDLFLSVARGGYHGLYIEMKSQDGKLSTMQKKFGADVTTQGYKAVIARDWIGARKAIEDYLSAE